MVNLYRFHCSPETRNSKYSALVLIYADATYKIPHQLSDYYIS